MNNFLFSILFAGLVLSSLSHNSTACPPGTTLINSECAPLTYIEGCSEHSQCGVCLRCEFGYTLDQNDLCKYTNNNNNPHPNCCFKTDSNGYCTQCADGLFLQNSQCYSNPIYGCIVKQGQNCIACGSGYSLSSGKCYYNLVGCQLYNSDGTCNQCNGNITTISGAQYKYFMNNGICIQTKLGFSSSNSSGTVCSSFNQFGCTRCISGYYLTTDRKCVLNDPGCLVYQGGVCKQCSQMNGFVWNVESQSCQQQNKNLINIAYCISYTSQSASSATCSGCFKGYRLVNNVCQPESQLSIKIRKQCGNGYFLSSDNSCKPTTPTGNLIKHPDNQLPAILQPGCVYQYGVCQYCSAPFQMVNGKCAILNCRQIQPSNSTGSSIGISYLCKSCQYPFQLNGNGQCQIKNCAKYGTNLCIACANGYHLQSGQLCQINDINCLSYDSDGNCQACKSAYVISSNGDCMKKQSNCLTLANSSSGFPKCIACVEGHFLNTYNQCQKMDINCKYYVNGACKACNTRYFLYNYICFPYSKGCVHYSGKDCRQCARNYTLVNNQCFTTKPLGMKLLGTDDSYDFDIYPIDITKSKYYIDNLSPISGLGQFIYSSAYDKAYLNPTLVFQDVNFANANRANGWKSYYNQSGQSAGFALDNTQAPVAFYALQLQFIQNCTIDSFYLQYTKDLNNWVRVTNRFFVKDYFKSDSADYLKNNGVITIYFTGVYAQSIRIVVDGYTNWPATRIQFFYYDLLRYKKISNIKSLLYLEEAIQTNYVNRVDNQLDINQNYFFNPQTKCNPNQNITCFTGLELCQSKLIDKIQVINGGNGQNNSMTTNYVNQFYIMYSNDGRSFQCWNTCTYILMNQNSSTTTVNSQYQSLTINLGITAKNIRVYPAKWVGQPQLSIEYSYQ